MRLKNNCRLGRIFIAASVVLLPALMLAAESPIVAIKIHADQPGAKINPAMWGIFFEDINFGADGGLYAELVKNRGFEFPDPLMGWSVNRAQMVHGEVTVRTNAPFNLANPHYIRLRSDGGALFGVSNEGFRGMGVKVGRLMIFPRGFAAWEARQS